MGAGRARAIEKMLKVVTLRIAHTRLKPENPEKTAKEGADYCKEGFNRN